MVSTVAVRDPVCGAIVDPKKVKGHKEDYKNTLYYFCSDTCRNRFRKSPEDYVTLHA